MNELTWLVRAAGRLADEHPGLAWALLLGGLAGLVVELLLRGEEGGWWGRKATRRPGARAKGPAPSDGPEEGCS